MVSAGSYGAAHGTRVNLKGAGDCPQRQPLTRHLLNACDIDMIPTGTPKPPPLRFRTPDPGDHPIADQIPLKLRDRSQHVKEQSARWRRRVDRLVEDDEVNAEGLELLAESDEMVDASRETVELRTR